MFTYVDNYIDLVLIICYTYMKLKYESSLCETDKAMIVDRDGKSKLYIVQVGVFVNNHTAKWTCPESAG